ncbi:DUF262 domain-containing protein [Paraneptunicella aestuarii]|uniref:DUF262 domain-containing protein n=1 Tax=Paraneptunicella aestuarii TaxID=2831148 RepID=UPI001E5D043E|nr:DUF262 domain-containing protein [Paraneptunicella aestuarii]UAA39080.1 DUF262 domain-containing protein [Paraneptunicella aestuarii]
MIAMKIEAEIKTLKKILVDDEKFYQVPDYQRPYSWEKDNLNDLVDDLTNSFLTAQDETYFCGSLVLVSNPADERFDIIDGQQRTTTFTILACVLRDLYFGQLSPKAKKYINNSIQDEFEDQKRKLKFLTHEKYQIDFEETVLKGIKFRGVRSIERDYPDNRYLLNAHFLKELVEEKISESNINIDHFIIWLYENTVLTVITCPNQDSAIKIFNVLNDRGMPLSSIDILKSSLMQKLHNKEDRNAFKAKWENISSNLQFSDYDIESMLNTYLYFKLAANPKSRLDKELLGIFEQEGKNALEIIKEIDEFSHAYIKSLNEKCKYLYCLKYLRHRIYWSSILSAAHFSNYGELEKLKHYLVAYYYQNWIAGATVARIKQTSFNIIKMIKKNSPVKDVFEEMQSNLNRNGTMKKYKEELEGNWIYGRKWDRAALLLIEYFSTDDSSHNFIPLSKNLHLEHVLPQVPSAEWGNYFNSDEREQWTNSLANLTLLSMRKNIQALNSSFEEKKKVYQDKDSVATSFRITQKICENREWNTNTLEARQESLLKKANEKLAIF